MSEILVEMFWKYVVKGVEVSIREYIRDSEWERRLFDF